MWGVVPSEDSHFKVAVKELETIQPGHLLYAMATCHSLTVIDGNISGDPLDIKVCITSQCFRRKIKSLAEINLCIIKRSVIGY